MYATETDLKVVFNLPLHWFEPKALMGEIYRPVLLCQRLFKDGVLERRLRGDGIRSVPEYRRADAEVLLAKAEKKARESQQAAEMETVTSVELPDAPDVASVTHTDTQSFSALSPRAELNQDDVVISPLEIQHLVSRNVDSTLAIPAYVVAANRHHQDNNKPDISQQLHTLVVGVKESVEHSGEVARKVLSWF